MRIGPAFSTTTALVVCAVEVVLGSALITGWLSRRVALIGMGLVAAFCVFLLMVMARDTPRRRVGADVSRPSFRHNPTGLAGRSSATRCLSLCLHGLPW